MQRRIGIYSGTFDPIHDGHITFATEALSACNLDKVVFLPESSPRTKPHVTTISQRVHIIEQLIAREHSFSIFTPTSHQFSVRETLPELRQEFQHSDLVLLIGSDVMKKSFANWPHIDTLLQYMSLAIGMREDDTPQEIRAVIQHLEHTYNITIECTLVYTSAPHIASTHVRNSSLSSDILEEQFGPTRLSVLAQNKTHRIIQTISEQTSAVLELSLVSFSKDTEILYPQIHQVIYNGTSMGKAFTEAGVVFHRSVSSVTKSMLPSSIARYFSETGLATIVELRVFVGEKSTHYCDIIEIYSPAVVWPEKARSHSHSIDKTLQYFLSVLEASSLRI